MPGAGASTPQLGRHVRGDARRQVEPAVAFPPRQIEDRRDRPVAVDQIALHLLQPDLRGLRLDHLVSHPGAQERDLPALGIRRGIGPRFAQRVVDGVDRGLRHRLRAEHCLRRGGAARGLRRKLPVWLPRCLAGSVAAAHRRSAFTGSIEPSGSALIRPVASAFATAVWLTPRCAAYCRRESPMPVLCSTFSACWQLHFQVMSPVSEHSQP